MIYQISLVVTNEHGEVALVNFLDVNEMVAEFLEADFGCRLTSLNGREASKYVYRTRSALLRGTSDPAFAFMKDFRNAAVAHPSAFFRVLCQKVLKEEPVYYVYRKNEEE